MHVNGIQSEAFLAHSMAPNNQTSSSHVPPPAQQNYMNVDSNGTGFIAPLSSNPQDHGLHIGELRKNAKRLVPIHYINVAFITDGFNTLRSSKSMVTEASSEMTANVSDPLSSGGAAILGNSSDRQISDGSGPQQPHFQHQLTAMSQISPPRPTDALQQNDYYNLQQPAPVLPTLPGPMPTVSSRGQSASSGPSSKAESPSAFYFQQFQNPPAHLSSSDGNGAFSRVRPRTPPEERARRRERNLAEDARKSKLGDIQDLIHLEPPLSEDVIMRALQSRFFNQKYFVGKIFFKDLQQFPK